MQKKIAKQQTDIITAVKASAFEMFSMKSKIATIKTEIDQIDDIEASIKKLESE